MKQTSINNLNKIDLVHTLAKKEMHQSVLTLNKIKEYLKQSFQSVHEFIVLYPI